MVGTSNTTKSPVTKLCDEEKSRTVFHVGYYQDTTDRNDRPLRAGHYQSLEVVPGVDVPCCSIVAEVTEMDNDLDGVKSEEKILGAFIEDRNMVKMSLQRLMNLKCVNLDTLFSTNISHILYNDLRPKYAASTLEGKLCERLLKRYQSICINSPGFDQDDLPPITDVSEEESEESTNPRSFRSLFSGPRPSRASLLISEMGIIPEVVDDIRATDGLASSTVIGQSQTGDANPHLFEVPVSISITDCSMDIDSSTFLSFSTPKSTTLSSECSIPVITSPRPCIPSPRAKRKRACPAPVSPGSGRDSPQLRTCVLTSAVVRPCPATQIHFGYGYHCVHLYW